MDSIDRTRTNPSEQLTTQLKQMSCMRVGGGQIVRWKVPTHRI